MKTSKIDTVDRQIEFSQVTHVCQKVDLTLQFFLKKT